MRTRTAVHYNPNDDNDVHNEIRPPTVNHILWHEEANEFIKHLPKHSYKNDTIQQLQQKQQQRQYPFRHSTGGSNVGILYKHPSAIAMMTLNKRASHGDMPNERDSALGKDECSGFGLIVPENNGLVGNELLTVRQRHQRDLFSGDLGIPPIPPPPPPPQPLHIPGTLFSYAPRQRTHVGNVVHTFETLAMQRRLAAFKEQKPQVKIKNSLKQQQQQQRQQNTFSKYLKSNNRSNTNNKMRKEQEQKFKQCNAMSASTTTTTTTITSHDTNFCTKIKCNNNTTFNERNKQISQQFLHQMEIDYRKNLFSNQSHVNNSKSNNSTHKFQQQIAVKTNNNNNTKTNEINNEIQSTFSEGEAGVVAVFDEMLAGYSTTLGDDDDDNDYDYDNGEYDDTLLENSARVSIINLNGNEAQDNVLHINLSSTNVPSVTDTTSTTTATTRTTSRNIKQLNYSNTNQRLLPTLRKKSTPPLPPPKPHTKTIAAAPAPAATITTTMTAKQHHESYNNVLSQHHNKERNLAAIDNAQFAENNEFLRGTTLSQSFVCQSNWQHRKKPKAPKPPILPITTPNVQKIKSNTQLRIAITNPFRHVLRLNSKRCDSFNLLKPNAN